MQEIKRYKQIDYLLYAADGLDLTRPQPMILYLPGAGTRGRDTSLLRSQTILEYAKKQPDYPFVLVIPQPYADSWFDIFEQLQEFAMYQITRPYSDRERVYVCGTSMGAYATWQLAMSHPDWFAAIAPVCGGGMYWNAGRLRHMGVWAFHGEDDRTVYPEESRKMTESIHGEDVRLTIYPHVQHDAWGPAFRTPELYTWLLEHRLSRPTDPETFCVGPAFG